MNFDDQTLRDATAFVAVVRCGGFASAARSLNLSQSAASRSVARLEKRLGARVLDRTTRTIALTDEGRTLFAKLEPLLQSFEEAFASVAQEQTGIHGRLRVKMHPTLTHALAGPPLKGFLDTYPGLSLELLASDRPGDLVSEGVDVALTVGELPSSSLIVKKLLDTRVLTVAAPAYLAAHAPVTCPADLAHGHALIDYRNPEAGRPFQWEHHRGRTVERVATPNRLIVSDILSLHAMCAAGWGIAQVLEFAVRPLLASGALIALLPEWSDERFPVYAIHPSRSYVPLRTRAFLDFVAAAIRNA
jgi:DNA-binding transcriptional LysR family regulator